MLQLWRSLIPLILASAALPVQIILTLRIARSSVASAFAWVAGMMTARLIQGFLFGVVFTASEEHSGADSPRYVMGALLFVLAALLFVKALRAILGIDDADAPPPAWLEKICSLSPAASFGAGAGFMVLSIKFLMFTLGAIGAITEADLNATLSVLMFVLFVVLAASAPLTILALASSSSSRAAAILEGFHSWLQRRDRAITILFGLVFGTWFLIKALRHLAVF